MEEAHVNQVDHRRSCRAARCGSCGSRTAAAERGTGGPAVQAAQGPDEALVKKARAIHEKVITLDTHNDINPTDFTPERNYTQRLDTQVNLPKMLEGGLDASFFIVYVGQGPLTPEGYDNAYKQAVAKFEAVHRLTEQIAPDKIELALAATVLTGAERRQEVDGRGGAGHQLVGQRAELEPLGHLPRAAGTSLSGCSSEGAGLGIGDDAAAVRSEELVGRARVEVRAQLGLCRS